MTADSSFNPHEYDNTKASEESVNELKQSSKILRMCL